MLVIIAIIGVVVVLASLVFKKPSTPNLSQLYQKENKLFSPAERSFLGILQHACANDYIILGKIRVADIIAVKPTKNRSLRQKSFNRISSKHFDFVLCDKNDLSVQCVIELDDKSHQKNKRQQRDQFLDELCQAVKLTLVRFAVKRSYVVSQVRDSLANALGASQEPPSTQSTKLAS